MSRSRDRSRRYYRRQERLLVRWTTRGARRAGKAWLTSQIDPRAMRHFFKVPGGKTYIPWDTIPRLDGWPT